MVKARWSYTGGTNFPSRWGRFGGTYVSKAAWIAGAQQYIQQNAYKTVLHGVNPTTGVISNASVAQQQFMQNKIGQLATMLGVLGVNVQPFQVTTSYGGQNQYVTFYPASANISTPTSTPQFNFTPGQGTPSQQAAAQSTTAFQAAAASARHAASQAASLSSQAQIAQAGTVQTLGLSNGGRGYDDGSKSWSEYQGMSPTAAAKYARGATSSVDMPDFMFRGSMTQSVVYDTNINGLPRVVDSKTFDSISGHTFYRTVHENYDRQTDVYMSAPDIARQTMTSGLNRIGEGVSGDGHYFARSSSDSASYGTARGNVTKTCQFRAKIDSSRANIVTKSNLQRMLSGESKSVRSAFGSKGNQWGVPDLSAYALYKGYNVIDVHGNQSGYMVVIDRSVLVMDSTLRAT